MYLQEKFTKILNEQVYNKLGVKTIISKEAIHYQKNGIFQIVKTIEPIKAGWFSYSEMVKLKDPVIIIWKPDFARWAELTEKKRSRAKLFEHLESDFSLTVHFERLSGNEIQLYCASMTNNSSPNVTAKKMDWKFRNDIEDGKKLKRLGILSVSPGAAAGPNVPPSVMIEPDRPEADGALWLEKHFAISLAEWTGIHWNENISRLQIWMTTDFGIIKGMGMVGKQNCDRLKPEIVMPKESLDERTTASVTICKVIPHRVIRNPWTLKAFDGLLRMPELIKHVHIDEVVDVMKRDMEKIDIAEDKFAWNTKDLDEELDLLLEQNEETMSVDWLIWSMERRLYQDNVRAFTRLMGGGLFSSPETMEMGVGRLYGSVNSRRRRWNRGDDNSLPGCYVSAVRAYWTDPVYAGIPAPEPGSVKILWNDGDVDGFMMNPADMPCNNADVAYRSDGGDLDDLLDGVLMMSDSDSIPMIWLVRNPTSWGGGWFLRLDENDYQLLMNKGYHVYKLKAGYEVEGLGSIKNQGLKVWKYIS